MPRTLWPTCSDPYVPRKADLYLAVADALALSSVGASRQVRLSRCSATMQGIRPTRLRGPGGCRALFLALLAATLPGAVGAAAASATVPAVVAQDQSGASGLSDFSHTRGANVDDYDGNGTPDVMTLRHYESFPWLYLNTGAVFDKVGSEKFIDAKNKGDYHSCPSADVNRDGLLDFYCTVGGKKGGTAPNPNELWLRQPDGTYEERAGRFGVRDRFGRGRIAVFLFANKDKWPDLYVTNEFPRKDGRKGPNKLFMNVKGERFERARHWGVDGNIGGKSVTVVDYDRDGDEDLMLCATGGVRLYENRDRRFVNITRSSGAATSCVDGDLARFDANRRPDLVVLGRNGLRVYRQGPNGKFRGRPFVRKRVTKGAEFALGDANGDGRTDVYIVRRNDFNENRPADAQMDAGDRMFIAHGGSRLRKQDIPQDNRGIGEAVTVIDYDQNGLDDFIVQNGHRQARGPTRLIAFFHAP